MASAVSLTPTPLPVGEGLLFLLPEGLFFSLPVGEGKRVRD